MWEDLKVYKQLDKKDINPTFKKFGPEIVSHLEGYSIDQTTSIIKISRVNNGLEQAIFLEKTTNSYDLDVSVCIKPTDFYRQHRFTMINIVVLGTIMSNHRRTSYPLTKEWKELAVYISARINNEIANHFERYNTYEKIITHRAEIEPKEYDLDNRYELLIYAAGKTKNKTLLLGYLDKKIARPGLIICHSEFLKPHASEINQVDFLHQLKAFAQKDDFQSIEQAFEKAAQKK